MAESAKSYDKISPGKSRSHCISLTFPDQPELSADIRIELSHPAGPGDLFVLLIAAARMFEQHGLAALEDARQ